jgi:hypothetical protein
MEIMLEASKKENISLNGVEIEDTFAETFTLMEISPAKPLFFCYHVYRPALCHIRSMVSVAMYSVGLDPLNRVLLLPFSVET